MAELRLTRAARADLREIRSFSKDRFGHAAAQTYLASFNETFALLLERPQVAAMRNDLAPGIRGFSHRSHRTYFRVNGNRVEILRILHHAQDAPALLGDRL